MKLGRYTLNWDGWKHAAGVVSAALAGSAGPLTLKLYHGPEAPYAAAGAVVFFALLAFMCGAQSKEMLVREVANAVEKTGAVPVTVVEEVAKQLEDTKP